MPEFPVSRKGFLAWGLQWGLRTGVLAWILISAGNCKRPQEIPRLLGISSEEYRGFRSIQDVFLAGCPLPSFDLGLALDRYIYGHPHPIDTENLLRFLAGIPSSRLVAFLLDFSGTPLSELDPPQRERRLLSWKTSGFRLKRGLFSILRQISFFLVSSDKGIQRIMGYGI